MSVIHFILSALSIGVANICIEMFIIGFLFHNSQSLTPKIWRSESYKSYTYSVLLSFLFGALFTFFYYKIGSHYVLPHVLWSHIKLGLICFGSFGFITEMSNAIYINYNIKFALGKLIASFLTYLSAALIVSLYYWR